MKTTRALLMVVALASALAQIASAQIPGGANPVNVTDASVVNAAQYLVQQLNANASLIPEASPPVTLTSIDSATLKVVAGAIYGLQITVTDAAKAQFIVQVEVFVGLSFPPTPELTSFNYSATGNGTSPPEGSWQQADVTSQAVKDAAQFTLDKANVEGSELVPQRMGVLALDSIDAAQVLNYTSYDFDNKTVLFTALATALHMTWSDEGGVEYNVTATVWVYNDREEEPIVVDSFAAAVLTRPGGIVPADVDSDDIKDAAAFVVQEISAKPSLVPGALGAFELFRIVSATSQVVAGQKYNIWLTAEDEMEVVYFIKASVMWQAWMSPAYTLESVTGEAQVLPGGRAPLNVTDDTVKAMAAFALAEANADPTKVPGHSGTLRIVELQAAAFQVTRTPLYHLRMVFEDEALARWTIWATVSVESTPTPTNQLVVFLFKRLAGGATGVPEKADKKAPAVRAAAEFVIAQINTDAKLVPQKSGAMKLNKIKKATQQVVQGMKYVFTLMCSDGAGTKYTVKATVWVPLQPPNVLESFSFTAKSKGKGLRLAHRRMMA